MTRSGKYQKRCWEELKPRRSFFPVHGITGACYNPELLHSIPTPPAEFASLNKHKCPPPHRHLEGAAAGEVGMASSFTKLRGEWNAWAAAELRKGFGGSARAMRFLGDGAEARGGAEFEETGGGGRRGARPQKRGDSEGQQDWWPARPQGQERVRGWETSVSGGTASLGTYQE